MRSKVTSAKFPTNKSVKSSSRWSPLAVKLLRVRGPSRFWDGVAKGGAGWDHAPATANSAKHVRSSGVGVGNLILSFYGPIWPWYRISFTDFHSGFRTVKYTPRAVSGEPEGLRHLSRTPPSCCRNPESDDPDATSPHATALIARYRGPFRSAHPPDRGARRAPRPAR